MKSMMTKALTYLAFFTLIATGVLSALRHFVSDINGTAPDALHFIGFIALIPMISSVGGRLAARKTAYIKKTAFFKPFTVSTFIMTYLSFIPWMLTFFVAENALLIYIDWAIVLTSIMLSFALFGFLLSIYTRE